VLSANKASLRHASRHEVPKRAGLQLWSDEVRARLPVERRARRPRTAAASAHECEAGCAGDASYRPKPSEEPPARSQAVSRPSDDEPPQTRTPTRRPAEQVAWMTRLCRSERHETSWSGRQGEDQGSGLPTAAPVAQPTSSPERSDARRVGASAAPRRWRLRRNRGDADREHEPRSAARDLHSAVTRTATPAVRPAPIVLRARGRGATAERKTVTMKPCRASSALAC